MTGDGDGESDVAFVDGFREFGVPCRVSGDAAFFADGKACGHGPAAERTMRGGAIEPLAFDADEEWAVHVNRSAGLLAETNIVAEGGVRLTVFVKQRQIAAIAFELGLMGLQGDVVRHIVSVPHLTEIEREGFADAHGGDALQEVDCARAQVDFVIGMFGVQELTVCSLVKHEDFRVFDFDLGSLGAHAATSFRSLPRMPEISSRDMWRMAAAMLAIRPLRATTS